VWDVGLEARAVAFSVVHTGVDQQLGQTSVLHGVDHGDVRIDFDGLALRIVGL